MDKTEDIVAEQVGWWQANSFLPCDAWDAMGGSRFMLVVTWSDVALLCLHHAKPDFAFARYAVGKPPTVEMRAG